MLTIVRELITPEIARSYLLTTKHNRTIDSEKVSWYAFLMTIGDWKESRYIEFTEKGDLINGQHRLSAIVRSGIAQSFLVVRGLPIVCRV